MITRRIVLLSMWMICTGSICIAQEVKRPQQKVNITVDLNGNASVVVVSNFNGQDPRLWINIKPAADHAASVWLRASGLREHWHKLENPTLDVDQGMNFTARYTIPGFARRTNRGWEIIPHDEPPEIKFQARIATYSLLVECQLGLVQRNVSISIPGDAEVKITANPPRIHYTLPDPAPVAAGKSSAEMQLDAAPALMACLAKSYGYEKFPALWVGRTRFANTGETTLTDYRVRFRLTDFSPNWSPWVRTPVVLPGQSVIDPFFPVLDIEKISKIEGTRQCTMEIEYEYRRSDGQLVKDTDGRKVEIAGKNARLFDAGDEGPFDLIVHAPMICASFVSRDDPVIRMVAGRISGQVAGGLAADIDPFDAIAFVQEIHRFIIHNKIAYQTPPGTDLMQHHKYGREVLQNRAGTCVDLAVFYASVCEAVGLRPALIMPPGHCLVMIKLPPADTVKKDKSGKTQQDRLLAKWGSNLIKRDNALWLPFECTAVDPRTTFEQAVVMGLKNVTNPEKPCRIADLGDLRRMGIYPLELPEVGQNVLDEWKISPAAPGGGGVVGAVHSMVGDWRCEFIANGQQFFVVSKFKEDDTMVADVVDAAGRTLASGGGKWSVDGNGKYVFDGAFHEEATIRWINADSFGYTPTKSSNPGTKIGVETINRRVK